MDRESLLAALSKPKTTTVELDDGLTVTARKLTQAEVETVRKKYATETAALEGFRYVVSQCVVDDEGRRVFGEGDMAKLQAVDFDQLQRIATAIIEFSGLGRDAKKA